MSKPRLKPDSPDPATGKPYADAILAFVRAGGFPQVAAEAAGIAKHIYLDWIRRGELKKAKEPYRGFVARLNQARAQARLKAEMEAMKDDPRFWLRAGPGKETPENPGWTAVVRPVLNATSQTINLFMSPEFLAFLATLRQVLAPHPDALAAVTKALEEPLQIEHKKDTLEK